LYTSTSTKRKIDVYFEYLDRVIDLCKKGNYDFRTIDRVLYIFDKKYNGHL